MEVPENCKECFFAPVCLAPHYGGSRCQYKDEINSAIVEQMRSTEEETK